MHHNKLDTTGIVDILDFDAAALVPERDDMSG